MSDSLLRVAFKTNVHELVDWLETMGTKQVPFATAKGLTMTARDVRDVVRADLPKHFTLRSHWLEQGIRFIPAEKRDWPHQKAYAGTRDQFLELQETGGKKRPAKGARNVAIPTAASVARRGSSGRLPKSAKPRAILDRPTGYVEDRAIRRRLPKNRPGTATLALFLLRPDATIKPRFQFQKTAEATVLRVYAKNFREALQGALTAPKRPGKLR